MSVNAENYSCPVIPFDLDNDNICEIIAFTKDNKLIVYDHNLNVIYNKNIKHPVSTIPAIFDITLDGILDIIVFDDNGYLTVYNSLTGNIEKKFNSIFIGVNKSLPPVVADVDGDNKPEILIASDKIYGFDNSGKSKKKFPYNLYSELEKPLGIYDYNNDGIQDIIAITQSKAFYYIDVYNNKTVFSNDLSYSMEFKNDFYISDANSNNIPDILIISKRQQELFFIEKKSINKNRLIFSLIDRIIGIAQLDSNDTLPEIIIMNNAEAIVPEPKNVFLCHTLNNLSEYYNGTFYSNFIFGSPELSLIPTTNIEFFYKGAFLDYNNNNKLNFIYPDYFNGLYIFDYNAPYLNILKSFPSNGNNFYSVSIGDINGNKKGDIIYNDTSQIHIVNTNSTLGQSPLPFINNTNSLNDFHAAPPVIYSHLKNITKGSSYKILWRDPFYFNRNTYHYKLNDVSCTDYITDTSITFTNLPDNDYLFYLKNKDANGKTSLLPAVYKFVIDNKPPEVYFIDPLDNEYISDTYSIKVYAYDIHIDTIQLILSDNNNETILYTSNSVNSESEYIYTLVTEQIQNDTFKLILKASEIENNNYSETYITLKKYNTDFLISPDKNTDISMPDNSAKITIYKNNVSYTQKVIFKFAQLINIPVRLYSRIYYFKSESLNFPLRLSIKPTEKINSSNLPVIYYKSDDNDTFIKIGGTQYNSKIVGLIKNNGYYFLGEKNDILLFSGESDYQNDPVIKIVPRAAEKNSSININITLKFSSTVTVKIFNIHGQLKKILLNGSNLDKGAHTITMSSNNLDTGLHMAYININKKDYKIIFYIK